VRWAEARPANNHQYDFRPFTTLKFSVHSQNEILQFVRMSEASFVVPGVMVCASAGSVTATRLDMGSGGHIIVPSSAFLPSLAATLGVSHLGACAFENTRITSVTIPRHVQILCSKYFSHCKSLSSISFESDSELTRIKAEACSQTSLSLVIVPGSTFFTAGDAFPGSCAVTLAGSDCDAEFRAWNKRRQFDTSRAFERMTSDMGELATNKPGDDEERKTPSEPMGKLD
jgi:hypothetical protein